jgi:hypothetical protein
MIEKPKKERRFLKTLGKIGEILLQEVLLKVGSNLVKRIGGKKTLPSILFLFISISIFAQFPNSGNKQRLGFQTSADGLVWRGSISDTASIQPVSNQNAWVILDTVNLKIYSFDFTSNNWNQLPSGTTVDTTSLSNRINLKLNISDTAAMLLPYAKKSYVDTAGRFYARQDFTNVTSSTLTWTQTDTLVPAGVNVVQVYRNGQILLPTQYTIPTNASVVIGSTAFKLGENYTVIFPKGGGGSGSGGSGSLTSISGGTGITVSPNPITTTGTVSADLTVLMELSDTVTLSNRINNKVNISDTATMLLPYFRDADTSSLNLTSRFALKLNAADTASLSTRINAKGTGTVTSVGSGFGLLGGTITTTGTLRLDSATVFNRIRDSIVDVAIGNDTIKILKQEYAPALTSVLTWTITSKFPIQLKAYILVFRNGQLLNNDQFNLTDTNQITIVSTSFKVGANYTVATVSGIGSVGSAQGDPVYPEAGIAVSTGTTWTTSITNNSNNWNIAYNDKINNAVFTGTDTKTLTLTQLDGGTFAPTFTDLQGVTGSGTIGFIPKFSTTTEVTNSVIQESSGNIGIGVAPIANLTFDVAKNILLKSGSTGIASILFSETGTPSSTDVEFGGILRYNGILDRMELVTRDNLGGSNVTNTGLTMDRITGNIGLLKPTTISSTLTVTGNITEGGNNVLTNLDTASLSTRIDLKLNKADTASLSSRIDGKVSLTGDQTINGIKTFASQVNMSGQITISGSVSGANRLLGKNTSNNGVGDITLGTGLSLASNILTASGTDTTFLSDRINLKYNSSGGTISGAVTLSTTTATPTSLLGKDGSNIVGTVTTVAQTGLFGRGSVTNAETDANGNITVAHGFNFTPIMAFANLPAQTANVVNVKSVDGTNIVFVVRDGATYNPLNVQTVTKIEFFAIK